MVLLCQLPSCSMSVNGFVLGSFSNSCCPFNNSNPEWHGSFSLKQVIFHLHLHQEAIVNDKYAIGLYREGNLIGHIPVEISSLMYHFLDESTENCIEAVVIGKRKREIGLVVPAKYIAVTTDNMMSSENTF